MIMISSAALEQRLKFSIENLYSPNNIVLFTQ